LRKNCSVGKKIVVRVPYFFLHACIIFQSIN
jgi:hypothetical protein